MNEVERRYEELIRRPLATYPTERKVQILEVDFRALLEIEEAAQEVERISHRDHAAWVRLRTALSARQSPDKDES